MLPLTSAAPTTAERIRSACLRAGGALLAVGDEDPVAAPVHHLLDDGAFAVTVPFERGGAAGCLVDGAQALLELTDYAPLPLREPVRSLVWVRGRLHQVPPTAIPATLDLIASECPNPALLQVNAPHSVPSSPRDTRYALLRLAIDSIVVTDATGAEAVGVRDLLAARPDPFCEVESSLLWHLDNAHADVVARLVSRLPAQLRRGRVRPLGLDRYGLRFRVEGDEGDHDIRLPFHKPVDDMTGLSQAIRVLMGCPFINGLRARR
ncbi:DUF2470 domain-containing protein [Mycobacterium shigaense]|uniref:Uncharacterized protein n=1 Tax=Mycobacterium shigaense TaxID=722731 RepID=A0A1Z4EPS0_9MYCO|nr:DUF2470 domain-containing protein [Mycobacterium shigaense]MEA1121577.1 DUF2470 domain-containing protein [Mycobacterium shigaense]PRI15143.1 DUF2470 domain-containing protein [Mycobacterium shigaense]BAX95005.1 hypothetical protein MSG_04899 [Mycobacterium shigaense]